MPKPAFLGRVLLLAEFPTNPDGSPRPASSISAGPGPTNPQGSVRPHDGTLLGLTVSADGHTSVSATSTSGAFFVAISYPISADGTLGRARPPVPTGGRQPDLGSITVSR
jgi:hypothetical protein